MKYCKLCKVHIDTNHEFCPLCYNHLTPETEKKDNEKFLTASDLPVQKKKMNLVTKIFLMLSFIVIVASVAVNVYTKTVAWSVVVGLSILYLWVLIAHTIISHDNIFRKILLELLSILALLISTNLIFGGNDWLTNYVFPAIALGVSLVLSIDLVFFKKRKKVVFSFLCIILLLMLVSAIFLIFKIDTFKLLNQIFLIVGSVFVVCYFIFGGKTIIAEASRKFHI